MSLIELETLANKIRDSSIKDLEFNITCFLDVVSEAVYNDYILISRKDLHTMYLGVITDSSKSMLQETQDAIKIYERNA